MKNDEILFVVNPQSRGGGTGRRLPELRQAIRGVFGDRARIQLTERAGHASDLAERAAAGTIVAVGGDGSASEVANGLARRDRRDRPQMAVLPAGTGGDLVRTLGMPRALDEALRVLVEGEVRSVDWMVLSMDDGTERVGLNVIGMGMAGAIVARANRSRKRFGGRVTFAMATAAVAATWRAPEVEVRWSGPSGDGLWRGRLANVFVANGRYCGGGMLVGGQGRMDDGLLELTLIPVAPVHRSLWHARRLYDGTLEHTPGAIRAAVSGMELTPLEGDGVMLDVDGEQPGMAPAAVRVVEDAIDLIGTWRP